MRVLRRAERGQALTEYTLLTALFVVALFVPWVPDPGGGGTVAVFELF